MSDSGGSGIDGSLVGAIVAAIVATIGLIRSYVVIGSKTNDNTKRIGELEAKLQRHRDEVKQDFREYQKLFCDQLYEIKTILREGEDRRNEARSELGAFRERMSMEIGAVRKFMEERGGK